MAILVNRKNLGTRLVEAGIITDDQLQDALNYREIEGNKKGLLGQTLVSLGYCTEEDISKVVAKQADVQFISLEGLSIEEGASNLITPDVYRRYGAIPVGFDNGRLMVAMKNPADIIAIDDLRLLTGYEIIPLKASDTEIDAAIENYGRLNSEVNQDPEEEVAQALESVGGDDTSKPAVQMANLIFNQAVRSGASDIHIEAQEKTSRVRFRIDGVLHDIIHPPRQMHASLISRIKVMANMDIAERRIPQDGRITLRLEGKTVDFRVATLPAVYGEKVVMRLLVRSTQIITLDQLGFPDGELEKYQKIMHMPYGFILVTGPTGSGKSTSLYATLTELNSKEKNIITLEDPIEYRLDGITQVQINNKAGLTFANGLRSILRNDPDIVMVGEIRDEETARIAVESALTGHLVLSTLHTNDAAGAISRLGDMGIEPFLTASSLAGIIGQRLVRLLCPYCRESYQMRRDEILKSIPDFPFGSDQETVTLFRPHGCLRCSNTGFKGRMGVYELLIVSETIQRLALERASSKDIKDAAVNEGMITFRQDGLRKAIEGITSIEEVMRVVV
ncbi:MAG: GspE/PulE family protein [Ignavibacteriales bacterium]